MVSAIRAIDWRLCLCSLVVGLVHFDVMAFRNRWRDLVNVQSVNAGLVNDSAGGMHAIILDKATPNCH